MLPWQQHLLHVELNQVLVALADMLSQQWEYQALFSSPLSGGESKKRTGDEASSVSTIASAISSSSPAMLQ